MNKKYLKLALIGLAAGFCLSGKTAPAADQSQDEIAMAKCSRDSGNSCSSQKTRKNNCSECSGNSNCNSGACKPNKSAMKQKRSAAQKVVQGS